MIDFYEMIEANKTVTSGFIAFLIGAGVRVFDRFMKKKSDDTIQAQQLRTELRTDLTEANKTIDRLEEEVSQWREKYWMEVEKHAASKAELRAKIDELIDDSGVDN